MFQKKIHFVANYCLEDLEYIQLYVFMNIQYTNLSAYRFWGVDDFVLFLSRKQTLKQKSVDSC